jgi:hypothetical protein
MHASCLKPGEEIVIPNFGSSIVGHVEKGSKVHRLVCQLVGRFNHLPQGLTEMSSMELGTKDIGSKGKSSGVPAVSPAVEILA